MAKVTIIIPSYNRARFLIKAVASALNQSFRDRKVVVVDDGSTDNTKSALKVFGDEITYIYQPNAGVSSARNTGIDAAESEWIAFLDSDDEWSPLYLERQMERLECGSPRVCMQTANCCFVGLNGRKTSYFQLNGALDHFKGKDYILVKDPFRFIITHAPWQVGATLFSRHAILKAGRFDTSLKISEDLDLMARVALQGGMGLIREELANIYRRNESTESLTDQAIARPIEARESDHRIYEKLAAIGTLSRDQRNTLKKIMSSNLRAIGNLVLKDGNISEARASYQRALATDHSIRSLGRYILSFAHSHRQARSRGSRGNDSANHSLATMNGRNRTE